MSKVVQLFNNFHLALRRLKIKSLDLYSYFKSRINRTSHRRRSAHSGSLRGYISFLRNWRRAARISAFLLTLTIMAILFPISFKSSDHLAEAATGTAQDSTLTFIATSTTASATLNATDINGATATSNNNEKIAFSISTNNVTGYELSIKSSSGTTLSNGTDTLNAIGTSGIALNTFSNNTWGYLPNYYNSTENTNKYYYPITTSDITLNKTNTANSSNSPDSYTIGLGFKANYNVSAGTYSAIDSNTGSSSIILSYIANPVSYSITYNKNTGDTVTNMPYPSSTPANTQSGSVSATSITLSNTVPARTGYDFKGWCLGTVTTDNTAHTDTCNGTIYNPDGNGTNLTYGIDKTTANTTTIYAMWNIKTFTCKISYKLENADGSFDSTTVAINETKQYGSTCSWSRNADTTYQAASYTNNSITSNVDTTVSVMRNTFTCKIAAKYQNADGSYGTASNVVNSTLRYGQTCSWSRNADATYKAASYSTSISSNIDTTVSVDRNTFTVTKQYRLQGTDANYPSSYTGDGTVSVRYGDSYTYSRAATTTHQAASKSVSNVTSNQTISLDVPRKTFTITKRYRLQDTSGNYPSSYTSDGTVSVVYGGSYTYSRAATTTHQAKSGSVSNVTSAQTISLDVPRNLVACNKRYRLQGADGNYPSSYTGDGSVNAYYGGSCSYSKTVTDYNSNAAKSTSASNVTSTQTLSLDFPRNTYTLTVNRNTTYISSVSGGGTKRWGESVSISATPASNSAFNGWSVSSGSTGTFGNANNASTTYTMPKGNSTIYANGKSNKIYMWNATSANCGTTLWDNRDGTERSYTTASITAGGTTLCWMTTNLALGKSTTTALTSSTSNVSSSGYTLPASSTSGFNNYDTAYIYNSGSTNCSSSNGCYGYYSWKAATAGTAPWSGTASYDICPKGWRLPTNSEYGMLARTYNSGAKITASPFYGVYSGYYNTNGFNEGGAAGRYWSSSSHDEGYGGSTSFASTLQYYSDPTWANPGAGYFNKNYGLAIRCVMK